MANDFYLLKFIPHIKAAIVGWIAISSPIVIVGLSHVRDGKSFSYMRFSIMILLLFFLLAIIAALIVAICSGEFGVVIFKRNKVVVKTAFSKALVLSKPYNSFLFTIRWNPVLAFKLYSSKDEILGQCNLVDNYLIIDNIYSAKKIVALMDEMKIRHSYISLVVDNLCIFSLVISPSKVRKILENF